MTDTRFSSFRAFFPYYLGEHRHPTCRALHFVGTAGFFTTFAWAFGSAIERLWPYLLAMIALGVAAYMLESRRNAAPLMLAMIGVGAWAQPWLLVGVAWAYAFAWIGHFKLEHNKPATFQYPLWSLLGDFKMWGMMARGQLWSGDPLEELEAR